MENIDNYEKETICGSSIALNEEKGKWVEENTNQPELKIGQIDNYPSVEIPAIDSKPGQENAIVLPDSLNNAMKANRNRRPTRNAQRVVAQERAQTMGKNTQNDMDK